MTHRETWKNLEREVAEALGGKRNYGSGGIVQGGSRADVLHDKYWIECKYRSSFLHHSLFGVARSKAKKEGKIPIVVSRSKCHHDALVIIKLEDFKKLTEVGLNGGGEGGPHGDVQGDDDG